MKKSCIKQQKKTRQMLANAGFEFDERMTNKVRARTHE